MLRWMKRLSGHEVSVHDEGFVFDYAGTSEVCFWKDVKTIEEILTAEQIPILKIPGAAIKKTDRSFALHRRSDGKDFRFTVNTIDDLPAFAGWLAEIRDRYEIEWQVTKI